MSGSPSTGLRLLAAEPSWGHRVFRRVLEALANPGLAATLPGCDLAADAAWAVLFSAWDAEAALAAVGPLELPWQPNAPVEDAEVVVVGGASSAGAVTRARRGTEEHPEDGATIIYCLDRWNGTGGGVTASLTGPGVDGRRSVALPLEPGELDGREEACRSWPLGVDVLLAGPGGRVIGLPRTTRVELDATPGPAPEPA